MLKSSLWVVLIISFSLNITFTIGGNLYEKYKIYEPLVSVIMPVFDQPKHLNDAIESVLNQLHSNLELIIVDDGSIDQKVNETLYA